MTPPAAIMGDYCDLKFIKSRAVAQVIVEIPIEQSAAFVAAFGTPSQSTGVPVAIARINPNTASEAPKPIVEPSERERKKWRDMRPSQQAGIRCDDPTFHDFLRDRFSMTCANSEDAAIAIRDLCGVKSRADILPGTRAAEKWSQIENDYWAYLRYGP